MTSPCVLQLDLAPTGVSLEFDDVAAFCNQVAGLPWLQAGLAAVSSTTRPPTVRFEVVGADGTVYPFSKIEFGYEVGDFEDFGNRDYMDRWLNVLAFEGFQKQSITIKGSNPAPIATTTTPSPDALYVTVQSTSWLSAPFSENDDPDEEGVREEVADDFNNRKTDDTTGRTFYGGVTAAGFPTSGGSGPTATGVPSAGLVGSHHEEQDVDDFIISFGTHTPKSIVVRWG